ncbi:MAG: VTC domain-containing protein [Thermoleophilia bacterium]|nr:VTC domain-containing protein [Thermoleophilia bacterium]
MLLTTSPVTPTTPATPGAPATPAAPATPGQVGDLQEPFYGSRWERSFEMSPEVADQLQAYVETLVPRETEYPNPEVIQTVHVRSSYPDRGPKEKFRIRTYVDSPGPPNILEFKDKVIEDGHKVTKKVRIPLALDAAQRLMMGESGASVIGLSDRVGADALVAQRAIKAVDELGIHPVVKQTYTRTSFEDAKAGVRITFDRNIHYTGIGELVRAGEIDRPGVIMDVKVIGKTPDWLAKLITAQTGANAIAEVKHGKGSTAVAQLRERVDALDAKEGHRHLQPAA